MKVKQERNGSTVVFRIGEELTAVNAPELQKVVDDAIDDSVDKVVFDLTEMPYTSSAGLRVILSAQNTMDDRDGTLEVTGAGEVVMEIFEETGFITFLDITPAK